MGARGEDPHALVGREREREALAEGRASVVASEGAAFAITGQPGIGKTELLRAAAAEAQAAGFQLLQGRGTEFERDVPFGLIADALEPELRGPGRDCLEELGAEELAELAAVLPSVAPAAPAAGTVPAERFRLHFAIRAVIGRLAAHRPVALLLDDVHWADDASAELLAHLVRRGFDAPVLLVLAYRAPQLPRLLASAIAAAEREGTLRVLELAPLDACEAEAVLGGTLPYETRRSLLRVSGGNPLYLTLLGRAAQRGATPAGGAPAEADVPATLVASVDDELRALGDEHRTLLSSAAVAGEPFDLELAAEISGVETDRALTLVDELLAVDLVRPGDTPWHYTFRHPIVRHAVYAGIGPAARVRAHGDVARALAARGAPLRALAHHVLRSARPGDEQAVDVLTRAAHEEAPRAPSAAAEWLSGALRLLPAGASTERRLGLLIPLATALGSTGRVQESRRTLGDALPLLGPDQAVLRARLVGAIARLGHMIGDHSEGRALLLGSLAEVGTSSSAGSVALHLELAMDHWLAAEWSDVVASAQRARAHARENEDGFAGAVAAALEASGLAYAGDLGAARALYAEAQPVIDAASDTDLAARVEALMILGHLEFALERVGHARAHFERGLTISRATGQDTWFALLLSFLASTFQMTGPVDDAVRAADAALASSSAAHRQARVWALTIRSWVLSDAGDLAGAVRDGEEACALMAEGAETVFSWLTHSTLAHAYLLSGRPDDARRQILDHAGGPDLDAVDWLWRPRVALRLTMAAVSAGDLAGAEEWVRRGEALAQRIGMPGRLGEARTGRAALELARGRHAEARRHAFAAVEGYTAAGWSIEAGSAAILHARACAAGGARDDAAAQLRRVYAEMDALGASRLRDEASDELRRLGDPRAHLLAPRTTTDPELLTDREREIADLAARGLTNRQIAEELVLSPRTIEAHLRRVFRKLGVASRVALIQAWAERERT